MKTAASQLDARARELRGMVGAGRYGEAQAVFEEYCRGLAELLSGLPPGDARAAQLRSGWQELLVETRRRVLAGRAHAAVRRGRLPVSAPSYAEPPEARHSWQILA
jgi:hypothetical protein